MSWSAPSTEEIGNLLKTAKTVAVVGVSNKPDRASHQVAKYLIECGDYEVYLVNPLYDEVLGQKVYKSLEEIPVAIDIVDVFRKVVDLPPVFASALAIKAKNIWLQLGISDLELANQANAQGIGVVMDRCLKVDHAFFKTRS
jgi:predicted CoA-binding protein